MAEKAVRYDIDGYEIVTTALLELLNAFPGLKEGDEITFSNLNEDSGKAMFPISGAVLERTDILGNETYLYPFYVIYRAGGLSENNKVKVKEWLDNLGRWLEKKKVVISDKEYQLENYPTLSQEREFIYVERQTPGYLDNKTENTEDWAIYIMAHYRSENRE